MKKFLASVLAALTIIFFGGIASATPALAASAQSKPSLTSSVGVAKAAPTFVTKSTTPVTSAPKGIGGGVVKPFYRWLDSSYCYWSGISTRSYYCYRYGCTYFEKVAWGCYDGYVRITTYTYA